MSEEVDHNSRPRDFTCPQQWMTDAVVLVFREWDHVGGDTHVGVPLVLDLKALHSRNDFMFIRRNHDGVPPILRVHGHISHPATAK